MPITVIVGGQFGSEGKGKVSYFMAREMNATVAVRVGGPNSGHTVVDPISGHPKVFRQLPTAALLPNIVCIIAAGSYIDIDVLCKEIDSLNLPENRLLIDPNAVIITEDDRKQEQESSLRGSIGSTLSGTGSAVCKRIQRNSKVRLAQHEDRIRPFVKPVLPYLRSILEAHERVIIEGTQGFGLSLLHAQDYPYVTSRDTTAASFVSEVGLSPLDVDDVVLVIRAFPIRVAGNSGPLPNEINWDTVSHEAGKSESILERTSVTQLVRRVARFHPDVVRSAILANKPTRVVLNHLDYIDANASEQHIPQKIQTFINEVSTQIQCSIDYWGFGSASLISSTD